MKILLIVYDNLSYIHWFPQGLAYIAAVLKKAGYDVDIFSQDQHHYPDEFITKTLDETRYDAVGVSVIGGYYQYAKLLTISEAINNSKQRPYYMLGGHGPSPEPDYFFKKTGADAIIIGEGEETVLELLSAIGRGRSPEGIHGVAWQEGGKTIINERRRLIKDVDTIPLPAYEEFPMEYYRLLRMPHCSHGDFVIPILSGRGCTFRCNFCYRMDKGFRGRSSEAIIEEIKLLKKDYGMTYAAFSDELLMSSEKRTMELCEAMISAELNIKWDCNGRLNYAKSEILDVMKRSGCVFINYGIECFDDQVLKNMNKRLTTDQIIKGIEASLDAGISPGFNIIFGNIGENRRTLQQGVDFLLKYDDGSQMRTIRPVTPYPGCDLYDLAIEKGLLRDVADFYENKHTNSDLLAVNFTELTDDEYYAALKDANISLLENYHERKLTSLRNQVEDLYTHRDASFRGFRQS